MIVADAVNILVPNLASVALNISDVITIIIDNFIGVIEYKSTEAIISSLIIP